MCLGACGIFGIGSFVDLSEYEPLPALGELDLGEDLSPPDVLYWELRSRTGLGAPPRAEAGGGSVTRSELPVLQLETFDSISTAGGFARDCTPECTSLYLVTAHADGEVRTWTTPDEVRALLSPIRTPSEAATMTLAEDYRWLSGVKETGAYRSSGEDWLVVATRVVRYCPYRQDRFLIRISGDGQVTVLDRERYQSDDACV